jgi:hypothetical protein
MKRQSNPLYPLTMSGACPTYDFALDRRFSAQVAQIVGRPGGGWNTNARMDLLC